MYISAKPIRGIAQEWKRQSRELGTRYGISQVTRTLDSLAADLLQAVDTAENRLFNLTEAAEVSGYSADHLGRLVRAGTIPNAGRPNAPKIALRDLPMRPGHLPSGPDADVLTEARADTIARSIVSQEKEANDG